MYSTVLRCLLVVLQVFLALLHNHYYSLRLMKGVTVLELCNKAPQKNTKTTSRHRNTVEYIVGKSFLFISLKDKLDLTDLTILFLIQSLLLSTVACDGIPSRPAERSRVTYGK